MPIFARKSFAVVADGDLGKVGAIYGQGSQDNASGWMFTQCINTLCRILQHIGERLRHEPPIKIGENRFGWQLLLKCDVRATNSHQKDRLAHAIGEVVPRGARFGRAGKGGKFVDHSFDVVYLPNNRVRALVEYVPALDNMSAVTAFQPLSRELDRRFDESPGGHSEHPP